MARHYVFRALYRVVARQEHRCSWCRYPIVELCSVYAFWPFTSRWLGSIFCSARCGDQEARVRGLGPVEVIYAEGST